MLTSVIARMLPVVLAVSFLAVGCAGGASAPTPLAQSVFTEAAVALIPAGPLGIPAASFWAQGTDTGNSASIVAGGCADGSNCPAFAVITGVDADLANEPILDDGIGCPGGVDLTPHSGALTDEEPATVAGDAATLRTFSVDCVDADGAVQITVDQRQWSVLAGADGVTVVDRWAFEGLGERLEGAQWRVAGEVAEGA